MAARKVVTGAAADDAPDAARDAAAERELAVRGLTTDAALFAEATRRIGGAWQRFYKNSSDRFFKDRHYLEVAFPELAAAATRPVQLLELGCGVGNAFFPLLARYPHLFVTGFDVSRAAIEVIDRKLAGAPPLAVAAAAADGSGRSSVRPDGVISGVGVALGRSERAVSLRLAALRLLSGEYAPWLTASAGGGPRSRPPRPPPAATPPPPAAAADGATVGSEDGSDEGDDEEASPAGGGGGIDYPALRNRVVAFQHNLLGWSVEAPTARAHHAPSSSAAAAGTRRATSTAPAASGGAGDGAPAAAAAAATTGGIPALVPGNVMTAVLAAHAAATAASADDTSSAAAPPLPVTLLASRAPLCFGFDLVLSMFVLSAMPHAHHGFIFEEASRCLRPGGRFLFRDYGVYDAAELRFSPQSRLDTHLFVRGDGTLAAFCTTAELRHHAAAAGLRTVRCDYVYRAITNRAEDVTFRRVWINAVFEKPREAFTVDPPW